MRMIGPDFALFIVGALLFAGATYGLVVSENGLGGSGGSSNVNTFNVAWKLSEQTSDVGTMTEGAGALDKVSTVNGTGIEKVVFVISCNDPNPARAQVPFVYTVEITQVPEGVTAPAAMEGVSCGPHEMVVPVQPRPKDSQVNAGDAATAKTEAAKLTNSTGSGDYGISIVGNNRAGPPLGGGALKATVTVQIKVVTYAAEVTP
ncbi:MAG TPA: hypothetical protein VNZ52_14980, partial [Candidatus Thermoplasmatota archaeon]|nr:hypothetical protein [Candidatus Thermoplasmatota archaeon]